MEFNLDGSIKLPKNVLKKKEDDKKTFLEKPSIRVIRNQISSTTPLKCELTIQASERLSDPKKIESIFKQSTGKFSHMAQLSIKKINNREFLVKITSGMYRCSWCNNFREFLGKEFNVEVINQGSCFEYISSKRY